MRKIIPVFVLLVIVISSGVTYAWLSWTSTNTSVTFNIAGVTVTYNASGSLAKNLIPTASRTNSNNISRTITVSSTQSMRFDLYLDLTTLPDALTESSFKWEIYNGSTKLNYGDFSNSIEGDTITILSSTITSTSVSYVLYIWIDGTMSNPTAMQNKTFLFNLRATATDEPSDLPSGYTQVEYLQSSGTQYINTGFISSTYSGIFSLETKINIPNVLTTSQYFGGTGTSPRGGNLCVNVNGKLYVYIGQASAVNPTAINYIIGDNIISSNIISGTSVSLTLNGTTTTLSTTETGSSSVSYMLFRLGSNYFIGKMYYFRIYGNGTLVRNMIPAVRNSDYAVGMYDTVNNTFYTNAGTGTFSYG